MAADVQVLTLADRAEWEREEETGALPSQSWRYANALKASGFEPQLAVVRSGNARMMLPYFEREWRGSIDIASLPGLSGASVHPASSAPLASWREFAIARGWVCGYLQLDPTLQLESLPPDTELLRQNSMFVIDPTRWSLQSTYRTIRQKATYAIRRGARAVEGRALLGALQDLYPATLARFGSHSRFQPETIEQWAADPENLMVGVERDGKVQGVHLIHVLGQHAEAHLGGVTEEGRDDSVMLYLHALQLLAARGVTSYNLGAGGNEGDGVYQFKKWLGARPLELRSLRQIYDPARFAALCADAGEEAAGDWFPPYRRRDRSVH